MRVMISSLVFTFASAASAQNMCAALLQGGTFDTASSNRETFAADFARSKFCNAGSNNSRSDFKLGVPIEDVPVELGFNSGGSNSWNVCDEREASAEAWQKLSSWSRRASSTLARAFVECTKNEGIQVWAERSTVVNAFSLNASVRYLRGGVPPVAMRFSFTPKGVVRSCAPVSMQELETGVPVQNLGTFKVDCELSSYSRGVAIGLVSDAQIPYGNLSVRPYLPKPLIAHSTSTSTRNGVETPGPHDQSYPWGADSLLDEYEGNQAVAVNGVRWASWRFDQIIPGQYDVYITYAIHVPRPLKLRIDGNVALDRIATETTDSDVGLAKYRRQFHAGRVMISQSSADIRLEALTVGQSWPHFKELRLVFAGD